MTDPPFPIIELHNARNHAHLISAQKPLPVSNAKSGVDVGMVLFDRR